MNKPLHSEIRDLKENIEGDVYTDMSHKIMYATDASAYREMPTAVVIPKNVADIKKIICFANETGIPIIPRGAGTSLAGQVVGSGIIIDMSIHFTEILELNVDEKWVVVQPGVILNQLNRYLKPFGLFFGPETSTASRCTLGGMLGNNSCGLHSVIYGSTREHTLEAHAVLSDGTEVVFKSLTNEEFEEKCCGNTLENSLYRKTKEILSNPENQSEIRKEYPDMSLPRRNTGYAIDVLLESQPFTKETENINLCKLLAGSEGTLAFTTSIKLNLVNAPPKEKAVICAHFNTMDEALKANIIALKHSPGAVELMDDQILKLTEGNLLQQKNRFFLKGNPGAILIIEFARESREEILKIAENLEADLRAVNLGTHFPIVFGQEKISMVWALRQSALGVLSNMPGDAKPVSVIEDTAVSPSRLPDYISEFKEILKEHNLSCIFHAHVGSGEIHLRPVLNLKDQNDVERFREIASDTARLVKKYKGSLSGEHGDGRLRGEFIPLMIGEKNYQLLKAIKQTWDPENIFNPGKIIDTPRMNSHLRYKPGQKTREIDTVFDFSDNQGMIRSIEKCNGSGDCKNTSLTGSTLCPSYHATLDEKNTTRARANLLREFLTNSNKPNLFDQKEIHEVLAECLSCKACKSECPSSVDMAKLKAEFTQHYYDIHGPGLRNRLVANINLINRLGSLFPSLFNYLNTNKLISTLIKKI
ncbi:FAD-binding oxidoreductase, partial [bacterium]|nr:FAD-binding oxidoreductase [bacterium]